MKLPKFPSWFKVIGYILFAVILAFSIEGGWWWLFIVVILGMVAIRIYQNREYFMFNTRLIETKIWGKPLDKENWEKGELKNIKIKIDWRKKK